MFTLLTLTLILALPPLVWVAVGILLLTISSALSQPKPIRINLCNLQMVLSQMKKGIC